MAWKIEPRSIKNPIENTMKKKKASWRRLGGLLPRLGGVLGLQNPPEPAGGGRGGGGAGATPRKDSERIRIIRKEYNKEVRWDRRLEYGTLYAMRRHKAWRGGSTAQQSCDPATAPIWILVVWREKI